MNYKLLIAIGLLFAACSTEGVEQPAEKKKMHAGPELLSSEKLIEPTKTIVDRKEFPNGIKIQWFEKKEGVQLEEGHVYEINYKVKLVNGDVVDGNHLLKHDMLPFLVGYGLQTSGWDIAMKELHQGDFVEIYLPANLARGERGIEGVIPPNSPNIIFMRVGKEIKPSRTVDGTKVWLLKEAPESDLPAVADQSQVALHFFVGSKSHPKYDNSYKRDAPFDFHMDDHGLVPGFRKALMKSKLHDKLWILVPPAEAYGAKGYLDLVKPNESVFYDIFVVEVDGKQ